MTVNTDSEGNGRALRIIDDAVRLGGHLERARDIIECMSSSNANNVFARRTDIALMQTGNLKRELRAAVRAVESIEYQIQRD